MRKGLEHFVVLGPALKFQEINFNEQRGRSCVGSFKGIPYCWCTKGFTNPPPKSTKVTIHPVEREEDVPHPLSIFWFWIGKTRQGTCRRVLSVAVKNGSLFAQDFAGKIGQLKLESLDGWKKHG